MMLNRKTFFLFTLAIAFGLAAAMYANRWIQGQLVSEGSSDKSLNETVSVVVAAQELAYGQKIEADHIKSVDWPSEILPSDILQDKLEVVGKVTNQRILPGEPIAKARIVDKLDGSTLSAMITPNKRAISVRVNDVVGVAGFLLPGNRVDVLASRKKRDRVYTKTVLENLKVLAVDQTATPEKDKPVVVRAVTLEATPEQSVILVKSTEEGSVQLVLRNPIDTVAKTVENAKTEKVEISAKQSMPAEKPKGPRPSGTASVSVVRGVTVQTKRVRL